jgi:hypothetical protein
VCLYILSYVYRFIFYILYFYILVASQLERVPTLVASQPMHLVASQLRGTFSGVPNGVFIKVYVGGGYPPTRPYMASQLEGIYIGYIGGDMNIYINLFFYFFILFFLFFILIFIFFNSSEKKGFFIGG